MDQLAIIQDDGIKEGQLNQFKFEFTGTSLKFYNEQDKSMEFELKIGEFSIPEKEIFQGNHLHGTWKYGNGKFIMSNVLFGYSEVVFASCSK